MVVEEKIALIEEIMDLSKGTLSSDSKLSNYEEWDSLTKLSLIVTAKQQFDLILTVDDFRQVTTVKDLCDLFVD